FHFVHGTRNTAIIDIWHGALLVPARLGGGRLLQPARHGESAHLFHHPLIAALRADRLALGVQPPRKKVENHPAFRTGKFVNGHNSGTAQTDSVANSRERLRRFRRIFAQGSACVNGLRQVRVFDQTRSLTASLPAPFSSASGDAAFERSPPSTMMFELASPSTWRNFAAGVRTRQALNSASRLSASRRTELACGLPCALSALTAASST